MTLRFNAYRGRSILLLFMLLFVWLPAANARDNPTSEQVDALVKALTSPNTPGLAILVRSNGQTLFERGYGLRDLRSDLPITPDTAFRLASMSKQFTAMAIMLLIHDGKLRYEDRLTGLFPEFPPYGQAINIRELLNHTSGLRSHEDIWAKQYAGRNPEEIPQIQDEEVLKVMEKESSTKFSPGTQWEYSNTGYILLDLIVEKVSGMSFGAFLRERIFAPLGMNHSLAYQNGKNTVSGRAYGYTTVDSKWMETDQSPVSGTLGDGGIYSSIEDLRKWDDALWDHSLLSPEEMLPAITPVLLPNPERLPLGPDGQALAYGFGWRLDPYRGHHTMSHRGGSVGFHTDIERFTDDHLTIIVLANRTDIDVRNLAHRIADLYLDHTN